MSPLYNPNDDCDNNDDNDDNYFNYCNDDNDSNDIYNTLEYLFELLGVF